MWVWWVLGPLAFIVIMLLVIALAGAGERIPPEEEWRLLQEQMREQRRKQEMKEARKTRRDALRKAKRRRNGYDPGV